MLIAGPGPMIAVDMAGRHPTRLSIDLQSTGDTVCGWIAIDRSEPDEFFGWLDLIDRITRAAGTGEPVANDASEPVRSVRTPVCKPRGIARSGQ